MRRSRNDVNQTGEGKNEESNIVRANVILAIIGIEYCGYDSFSYFTDSSIEINGEGELLRLSQIYGRGNAHRRRASDLIHLDWLPLLE